MRTLLVLSLVLVAGTLAACASRPTVEVLPLTTQEYPPKPQNADMPMFASVPARPHAVLADIRVEGSENQADSCVVALMKAGREVGADALVLVHWEARTHMNTRDNYGPRGRVVGTSITTMTVPTLIAKAVVWTGRPPLGHPEPTRLGMMQLKR